MFLAHQWHVEYDPIKHMADKIRLQAKAFGDLQWQQVISHQEYVQSFLGCVKINGIILFSV